MFDAETDHIVIFQDAARDFFAVDEYPVALAAIFEVVTAALRHERGTLARNARVPELQVLRGLAGAADEKRRFGDAHKVARPVGSNNLEAGLAVGGIVRHLHDSTQKL